MQEKGDSIAIITARGGSKRIPRKNIKEFLGKPIIAYSIEAALNAGCFSEVMVSTDDTEIAEIAVKLGAKVPFMRSPETSDDYATTVDVLLEVIGQYEKRGVHFNALCCIYPTAPFINSQKLKQGMEMLLGHKADCVLPVVKYSYPIQRSLKMENGRLIMNWPENYNARSQDLVPVYHDCGQFYCMLVESIKKQKKLFAENTLPIITPEDEMQDIDNEDDWKLAEIKYSFLREKGR